MNSNFTVASSGINTVELRNLTEDRSLVLVNGRRFVGGRPGTQQVDLNAIPTALIERIDVVTGGSSAVYGSDALAGVINIILKDEFEGVQITGQSGISDEEDDETHQINLTAGSSFADGRGRAMVNLGWDKDRGVYARNRKTMEVDSVALGFFTGDPADFNDQFTPFFSTFSEKGRITLPNVASDYVVDDDGNVRPFDLSVDGFNRQDFRALSVPSERWQISSVIDFQLSQTMNFFAEINYASTESDSSLEPFAVETDDIYGALTSCSATACENGVPLLNPFVPETMRQLVRDANPGIADEDLVVGFARRTTELDQRAADNTRQTFRFVTGLEGDVGDYHYEVAVNYGRTTQDQKSSGQVNVLNMRNALDAVVDSTGNLVCRDAVAVAQGCLPVDIFGRGSIGRGLDETGRRNLLNYLKAPATTDAELEQTIYSGYLSGPIVELPAGPLRFVVGVEYREEKSESIGDVLSQQGLNGRNAIPPTIGSFDVWEVFGELEIPLLADVPGIQSLEANLAYRHSDYSNRWNDRCLCRLPSICASRRLHVTGTIRARGARAEHYRTFRAAERDV